MDDKLRRNLSMLFSLSSFAATILFFLLFIVALRNEEIPFNEIFNMPPEKMWSTAGHLFVLGWFPGLMLALISFTFLRRSQDSHLRIPVWIFSGFAILVSVVWFFSSWLWLGQVLPE